ncbi:AAA family ATPase [Vibrio sp. SM6]|uniref:AAA family ATPase n=1 Tax=Vibrio agarilyticus TaxID=2726741 RepID=A0A7X8YHL3_9VIBR|nr:AAA family ATPase [Vibrio agarilyticus]NLS13477.1 AAA family ATPase [Vibrio agarilyticus]
MQSPYVIELESQTELLERIALLSHFRSNLIAVSGESGSGKSWLAQRYLELKAQTQNQCLLCVRPHQSDRELRAQLLEQLLPAPLFNPDASLFESFAQLFEGSRCDAVVVIDDAHRLSDGFVTELWSWVTQLSQVSRWRVTVVLFSLPGHLDGLLTRLAYGQEIKPIELDIDPLSESEAMLLFEKQVARYIDESQEKRVRNAFRFVRPNPGDIIALGEKKVEKRIIIRSIVASPLNIVLLVALLVVLLIAGYWWLLPQSAPKTTESLVVTEQTVIPTLSENRTSPVLEVAEGELESPLADSEPSKQSALIADDSSALPPSVLTETVSVGVADEPHQRVVIESNVVDALLEGKPASVNTQSLADVAVQVAPNSVNDTPNDAPVAQAAVPPSTVGKIVVLRSDDNFEATPAETVDTDPLAAARSELNALPPRSYTLQLAALTSPEEVTQFIATHQLLNQVRIYSTVRQGALWYIVTYQDFATIQQARDAIALLPTSLQAVGPWAKSLAQVQRELLQSK